MTDLKMADYTAADAYFVPAENLLAYKLLFGFEIALRELLIDSLSAAHGPRWWLHHLPPDVLGALRKGMRYERSLRWMDLSLHHPMYYVDFPDLRKVVERRDNWAEVFKSVFGRKEVLAGMLIELEPIRNKVAHHRRLTEPEVAATEAAHKRLEALLGKERFKSLVVRCTTADDVRYRLSELASVVHGISKDVLKLREIQVPEAWIAVSGEWWFDSSYLCSPVEAAISFFELVAEFCGLPRVRGRGHEVEKWVKAREVEAVAAAAQTELANLLQPGEGIDGHSPGS